MPRLIGDELTDVDFVTKYEQACAEYNCRSVVITTFSARPRWTDGGLPVSQSSHTILSICSDILSQFRRCAFLREHGWLVLGSSSGHSAIVQFAAELVDVVVLDVDGDGAETAVIAAELKRTKEKVPIILLVGEGQTLVEGVVERADAVVSRLDESGLLKALERRAGSTAA